MTSENHTMKKLWLFFFLLFFFWYLLLYGFDWSSLPGLSSVSQENPGISHNDILISSSNSSKLISDVHVNPNEPPCNETTDIETVMGDLEKEVEALLPKHEEEQEKEEDKEKKTRSGCEGRYIYIQNLPSRFNSDYINNCKLLNKWHDMCPYFNNGGLGQRLSSSCWYVTHQFSLDVIFHSRMQRYDCLTNDSSKAAAIYVPYYPGLDVSRFLWDTYNASPSGDSFTRRSTFDSILAGCIPVFFSPASAYVQYLWHLPSDFGSYSVLIPEGDVKTHKVVSIDRVLSRIPTSRVAAMREKVIKLIPNVIYVDHRSRLEKTKDAFDLAIRGMVQRVDALRREMKEGRNSSAEFDPEFSWKYYAFGTTKQHEWDNYFKREID
ncbi:exostosin family protein [Striga asiatica]|uniref:Exostosin family protein n=1 Tax=Striga asiatica TaxID=4170 RepID=A0A5A7QLE8_STRAF|nr:exostosin family protein [Striga asiatica]